MPHRSLVVLVALLVPAGLVAQVTDTSHAKRPKIVKGAVTGAAAGAAAAAAPNSAAGTAAVAATGIPTCGAGQVLYMVPAAPLEGSGSATLMSGAMGAAMPAGVSMIDAAKKKYLKKDSSTAGAVAAGAVSGAATGAAQAIAGTPQYLCGTPAQAAQSMQAQNAAAQAQATQAAQAAQAGQSGMPSVGSMLSATPQGMMVNGAVAAAPMALAGAKKLGGMIFKEQTKESMAADLAKGKLILKMKFVEGTEMLVPDAENAIPVLAEALHFVEGQFALSIPAESDGKSPPDFELAKRRVARIAVHLLTSGITEDRVTTRAIAPASPGAKPATVKPGAARPELVRVPKVAP